MRFLPFTSLALLVLGAGSFAQQFKNPNNLGPDMPTPQPVVELMLKAARVKPGETVYDLGCGDGRIVITAAQEFDAKGVGVEMSRDIFDKTEARVKSLNLQDKVQVIHGNALHVDLSPADVVTLYLLTSSNDRLKPSLSKLHPGARVVSHDYQIRGWVPASVQTVTVMGMLHTVYVYEIKAKG